MNVMNSLEQVRERTKWFAFFFFNFSFSFYTMIFIFSACLSAEKDFILEIIGFFSLLCNNSKLLLRLIFCLLHIVNRMVRRRLG